MHSRTTDRGDRSHPPLVPKIPIQAVHSLIPRLTTTINDIDAFKALLASGNQDGSLPNWETLLHRYSMLLGRITALSNTIAQATRPATTPTLARHLVHPLNPLPEHANPLAPDTFFQVLNTQPLPEVTETQKEMLEDRSRMDERALATLVGSLRDKLERESAKTARLKGVIEEKLEEVDWAMRIGEDEEDLFGGEEETPGAFSLKDYVDKV